MKLHMQWTVGELEDGTGARCGFLDVLHDMPWPSRQAAQQAWYACTVPCRSTTAGIGSALSSTGMSQHMCRGLEHPSRTRVFGLL